MGVQVTLRTILGQFLSAAGFNANNADTITGFNQALDRTDVVDNAMEVDLDLGLNKIINLASTPTADTDASNKKYVDDTLIDNQAAADAAAASAAAAAVSEGNAIAAASSASTSETNAATSETNASTSETNAATSETNAATSETNAALSEGNASVSETNAALSESIASAAAITASAAATADQSRFLTNTDFITIGGVNNDFGILAVAGGVFSSEMIADPRTSLASSTGTFDYGSVV